DTTPVVKVIDFGVAKALGQELTDKTLVTGFAQMIGTPLYMSPEQAGEGGLDIDTRTAVYALGVLLYELLTGTTPFATGRVRPLGGDAGAAPAQTRGGGGGAAGGGDPKRRRGAAGRAGPGGGGGGGEEGGEKGPHPPLRDRQRLRRRRPALPARRAGAGLPAVRGEPAAEVRAAEPAGPGNCGVAGRHAVGGGWGGGRQRPWGPRPGEGSAAGGGPRHGG